MCAEALVPNARTPRIPAVDLMRGVTIAAMIVVNNPGSWVHMLGSLAHASWGAVPAPADFVFPFFLFLVGVATPLALARRVREGHQRRALLGRAVRRAAVLFAIGLFLNLFPQFDFSTVRIPGVLQRIALVSLGCAVGFLWFSPRRLLAATVGVLFGYAVLLRAVPVPELGVAVLSPEMSLPVWLDEWLLGAHTWRGPGDPEGVLSTLGALATGWIGVLSGQVLLSSRTPAGKLRALGLGGALAIALGAITSAWLPIAKEVWSSSYALVTAGAALWTLALLCRGFTELAPGRDLAWLLILGRQALLAYVVAHLLSDLSILVIRLPVGESGSMSLHSVVYQRLLLSWLPQGLASLAYALGFLGVVTLVVMVLDRRGVRLRA